MSRTTDLAAIEPDLTTQWAFRNKFINGSFDVWQRGTSFSITAGAGYDFTADRWVVVAGTGGTATVTRGTQWAGGDAGKWGNYSLNIQQTVKASTTGIVLQRVEDVRTLTGGPVTLSGLLVNSQTDASITINVVALQGFGTGGSTTVSTTIGTITVAASTSSKFSLTFDMPSISGKTLGASNCLEIQFQYPANVQLCNFSLSTLQIEEGRVASPFEWRPQALELTLCQRYYERLVNTVASLGYGTGGVSSATGVYIAVPFQVRKRLASPTVTFAAASTFYVWSYSTGNVAPSAITLMATSLNMIGVSCTVSGATPGQAAILEGNGGASYIEIYAEI